MPSFSPVILWRRHDFYGIKRSDWESETLLEHDYDFALHRLMFEEANAV
jgi:hypothetical protein